MQKSRLGYALAVLAASSSLVSFRAALAAETPDVIVERKDKKTKGTVIKEGPKEVTYKDEKDKEKTIAWENIVRIDYKDFPSELAAAEAAVDRRAYDKAEKAADDAIRAVSDGRFKDLFLTRACVAKARALRCLSSFKEAAEVAKRGIEAANGNRWEVHAHVERVAALAGMGSDEVGSACSDGAKACDAYSNEVAKDFRAEIALAAGNYYLDKGETSKAKEQYGTAENSTKFADRAKLGRARVKIKEKDLKGAEEMFQNIARSSTDADALAGASLGLGDTSLEKAKRSNPLNGDELRDALELYLRGAVLAQPTGGGASDNHEKTLRGAAQVCELIAGTISVPQDKKAKDWEKQASQRKFFVDYARKLYEDCVKTYPASKGSDDDKKKISDLKAKAIALSATPEGQK
ncbi:MAG: hypothetical protein ACAI25_21430 [Planctomycetota bacterium]